MSLIVLFGFSIEKKFFGQYRSTKSSKPFCSCRVAWMSSRSTKSLIASDSSLDSYLEYANFSLISPPLIWTSMYSLGFFGCLGFGSLASYLPSSIASSTYFLSALGCSPMYYSLYYSSFDCLVSSFNWYLCLMSLGTP